MLINTQVPWLFTFVDCNRPIYASNEHEIRQSYSFIWNLRWTEWHVHLQVDNTSTVYIKKYSEEHSLTFKGTSLKHGNTDECFGTDTDMLSGPEPTFSAVLRAGGGGGSPQPSKPQQAAPALFPTPQTTLLWEINFSGHITAWGHLVAFCLNSSTTKKKPHFILSENDLLKTIITIKTFFLKKTPIFKKLLF